MEKILITGASGFIGSHLVEAALSQGLDTHAGIRTSSSCRWLQDPRIRLVTLDFEQPDTLTTLLQQEDYDYIIHCAGLTKATHAQDFYRVNVEYLKTLTGAIEQSGITLRKFLFISSLAAYGPADCQPGKIVEENSTPRPVSDYGKSKLLAEMHLKALEHLPWLMIRPTVVYGPRETELLSVFKMLNRQLEILMGPQPQQLSLVYIKDLIRAIITCLFSDKTKEAYFITDGNLYTAEYFNNRIKYFLQRKSIRVSLSIKTLHYLAQFSEAMGRITGNHPILNQNKVRELACRSWHCKTGSIPGFTPAYFLDKGLPETIQWYRAHGWL